ncbi:MAG: sporulation protein [Rhodobacterales bacterium]|nr:MAG: sporulation protein [Rhodobacterales bacterium]
MRDVSGVPVVRALEGEMRVQPEDPGGAVAQHQGLAVNKVATGAGAEGPAEAVALAPDAGGLAEADGPVSAPEVTVAEAAPKVVTPQAPVDRPVDGVAGASADAMALIDSIVAENQPLSGEPVIIPAAPEAAPEVIPAAVPVVSGVIPTSVPGVVRSPRPPVRPAGIGVPGPMAAASASPTVREVPAAQVPAGTRLAQVGAFDSAEIARSEWATLSGRFEEFFQGKERVIEEARSGGDTFYRLRVKGFVDLADSRRFCAALVAGGAPCIPAVAR